MTSEICLHHYQWEVWGGGMTDLVGYSKEISTDGFKLYGVVGRGIFSKSSGISRLIRLSDHCSGFQAEASALHATMKTIMDMHLWHERSEVINYETVCRCRSCLNRLSGRHGVLVVWVPGYSYVQDKYRADKLARIGTAIRFSGDFAIVDTL